MNDDEAEELIPFGSPFTVTLTAPVNPFTASSETATGELVPPTCVEVEAGETLILKSAVGRGGGEDEPPQPAKRLALKKKATRNVFTGSPLRSALSGMAPRTVLSSGAPRDEIALFVELRG
jgi:hypothetical protein